MGFDIGVLKKVCPCSENYSEKTAYSTDSSTIKGDALAIAWPESYEHLKMLVKLASREGIILTPRGGGTGLVGGAVPKNSVVVDMSRLNKIKKLFLNEKAIVVQAGVILDKLNDSVKEYNLEFPITPNSHTSCTIGGMLATNAAGKKLNIKRFIKEWVKDITFMDGTGKVFTLDKNDARRFVGTEGTCGIILEATLFLIDKREKSTDVFRFGDLNKLVDKLKELREDTSVIEMGYVNSIAAQIVGWGKQEILLVKYSNPRKGIIEPAEAEEIWHNYENLYSVLVREGYPRVEDPFVEKEPAKLADWINKQEIPCYGNLASGNLHPHFKDLKEVEKLAKAVNELKGFMVGEHGVGILRRRYTPFGTEHNIRELKEKYDPKGIMNKGKVL